MRCDLLLAASGTATASHVLTMQEAEELLCSPEALALLTCRPVVLGE
eukprot:SAG22_NODE_11710_length_473_cov_0.550802_1_plen_46_part_10